jgi:hypothetical protein
VPCFVSTRWDQNNVTPTPLEVVGPSGTTAFIDPLFGGQGAYRLDIQARIEHPASRRLHEQRGGRHAGRRTLCPW